MFKKGALHMDFTLLSKKQNGEYTYKLFRTNFYTGYYLILAQSKDDFYCASICACAQRANELFLQIAESETPPFSLSDILHDFSKQALNV